MRLSLPARVNHLGLGSVVVSGGVPNDSEAGKLLSERIDPDVRRLRQHNRALVFGILIAMVDKTPNTEH